MSGGTVRVDPVRSRAERREFVELPYRLNRDLAHWVPPLRRDVYELIDPARHPFHEHGEVELFMARDARGSITGRIAAVRNDRYLAEHEDRTGFFGLFESIRDDATAAALLNAASSWVKAQGLAGMRGPMSFSLNEECGLLVNGFDAPPMVMMPYNPEWYAELLETAGCSKAKDLLAYHMPVPDQAPERWTRAAEALAARYSLRVRSMDRRRFWDEVALVQRVYNSAWSANWGHVTMTDAELHHMAKSLKAVVDPDLVLFAEVRGELAGFALALPDLNQALRHMNGRLLPFGWAKGLWHGRNIDALRILTLGVLEPYRRTGVAELMYLRYWQIARAKKMINAELSWILEDNPHMRLPLEKMGARVYRTYRIYDAPMNA